MKSNPQLTCQRLFRRDPVRDHPARVKSPAASVEGARHIKTIALLSFLAVSAAMYPRIASAVHQPTDECGRH